MAQSLDDILRELAKRGELSHVSIGFTTRGGFSASYTPATVSGSSIVTHTDPAEALRRAIAQYKPPKRRKPIEDDDDFG